MRRMLLVLLLAGCATTNAPLFVDSPEGRIHVDDGGKGPGIPVVFVHGNGANVTQWKAQLDHLRPTRRAIALELRGMGMSQIPASGNYSVDAMADDVHAVVEALRIPRFVIVGHSYGGSVVGAYAAKHPTRVAGVVFVDAAGDVQMTDIAAERFIDAIRADKPGVVREMFEPILENASPEVKAAVYASVDNTSIETFSLALEGMRHFSMSRALASYGGPKLAIVAADNTGPVALHVQFPDVPTKKIEGVSHWLMMDKPDEFNAILDEFLVAVH